MRCHTEEDARGEKGPFDARGKERKEKKHLCLFTFQAHMFHGGIRGKNGKAQKGATKSAVSENYVNIRYCNSQLIGVSPAYICGNVSAVMHRYSCQDAEGKFVSLSHLLVADVAAEVESRHTDR